MKKKMLIGMGAVVLMLGGSGCTYNDVYYNSQTYNVYEGKREIEVPYVYRHPRYPETHHLKPFPKHRHKCKVIDESCSRICEQQRKTARETKRVMNHNGKMRDACPICGK